MKMTFMFLTAGMMAAFLMTACASGTGSTKVSGTTGASGTMQASGTAGTAGMGTTGGSTTGAGTSASGSTAASTGKGYKIIKADEAKKMMDAGNVTIVDVRRADEFAAGHIPGAILVPNESIGTEKPAALPDTNAVLLVYCRTGIRAADASEKLVKMGYKNVYDMGGIVDWKYDTVKGDK